MRRALPRLRPALEGIVRLARARFLQNRWGRLMAATVREAGEDRAGDMAAAIAYYFILSLFPLLLGMIAVLGVFLPSGVVRTEVVAFIQRYLPGTAAVVEDNIDAVMRIRGQLGIVSLLGLFWTGSAVFGAIGRFINQAWDIKVVRPFYITKFRDLTVALGTSILFFVSLGATAVSVILPRSGIPLGADLAVFASRLIAFLLVLAIFLLTYRFLPNSYVPWRHVWPGALVGAIFFEIFRSLFVFYLSEFANYRAVYGPLASVIIFLVWIYISSLILILGAEFGSELRKGHLRSEV